MNDETNRDLLITAKILSSIASGVLSSFLSYWMFYSTATSAISGLLMSALAIGAFFGPEHHRRYFCVGIVILIVGAISTASLMRLDASTYATIFSWIRGLSCVAIVIGLVVLFLYLNRAQKNWTKLLANAFAILLMFTYSSVGFLFGGDGGRIMGSIVAMMLACWILILFDLQLAKNDRETGGRWLAIISMILFCCLFTVWVIFGIGALLDPPEITHNFSQGITDLLCLVPALLGIVGLIATFIFTFVALLSEPSSNGRISKGVSLIVPIDLNNDGKSDFYTKIDL